ncbi:tyrosine-protein phosphatase [Maribacter algicola]|uniref:Tyrosine-protein phosphatase n=1 Tax=Meishania litoralis TaxID=3434685 RepID=A0ACC7LPX5_9FLAO
MLTIFNRKKYLIDALKGFIDIHNHILPGVDDGAKTVEESIALIKGFSEYGIQNFIATPHIMDNYYPNNPGTISKSLEILNHGLAINDLNHISVEASAEHMIDSNFENLLANGEVMTLQNNYLLVEMSYLQASINFDEAIKKIAEHRLFPILAHPERYVFLQKKFKKYQKMKDQGVLFQMNLLSLGEFYGKEVQQTAMKLLEADLINFLASDVHNKTQLEGLKEIKVTNKLLDTLLPIIERTIYNFS